jgi:hypothetical protein
MGLIADLRHFHKHIVVYHIIWLLHRSLNAGTGCGQLLYYDSKIIDPKIGKNIPLDDDTDRPHRCQLYDNKKNQ